MLAKTDPLVKTTYVNIKCAILVNEHKWRSSGDYRGGGQVADNQFWYTKGKFGTKRHEKAQYVNKLAHN